MLPRIITPLSILSPRKLLPIIVIVSALVSGCGAVPLETAAPPTPVVIVTAPVPTIVTDTAQKFSSDKLGVCFSYPQGYTEIPTGETVTISAPDLPGATAKGLFWLEMSDAYGRTAERIANEDATYAAGVSLDRWPVTLDGEPAVVLDGMPGQELQRRVYVVHQQTLYVLAFWPARSDNKAAADQMEALYSAITTSWAWSPCAAS